MPSPSSVPVVKVFLSSPGDVHEERAVALVVLKLLQLRFRDRLTIVPILWEYEPLAATAGFQEEISRRIPPSESEVAVFVLWSRLGTPLSKDFALEDGRRPTGTEWEFLDARRASREKTSPHLLVYRKDVDPPTRASLPKEVLLKQSDDWAAVQSFFETHFRDAADLSFTGAFHAFRESAEFGRLLEQHLSKVLKEKLTGDAAAARAVTWTDCPFRALETFEAEHAPIFFGRSRATYEIHQALRDQVRAGRAYLLVVGASGSGKSSLLRAGVLPLLAWPGAMEEDAVGGFCRRAIFRPADSAKPLLAMTAALVAQGALPELAMNGTAESLAELFAESPKSAAALVHGALAQAAAAEQRRQGLVAPPPVRLVLLADQMEEMFTREGVTDADRTAFARILSALARGGDTWVLGSLRSDFYAPFQRILEAAELRLAGAGLYDLQRPNTVELGQIVRRPAQVAGLSYEVDPTTAVSLEEMIVAEAGRAPDSLPLLEYALAMLYERCKPSPVLTIAAYQEIGGIEGALRKRAEEEWAALSDEGRAAFPEVLRALVEVRGGDGSIARRRAPRHETASSPGAEEFVTRFEKARLLVGDVDQGKGAVVSVAHEALLRVWPRAAERLETEAELLRIRSRVRSDAARWVAEKKDRAWLRSPGKPLAEAMRLAKSGYRLTAVEQEYLDASLRRSKALRRARLRRRASGLAAASEQASSTDAMLSLLLAREAVRAEPVWMSAPVTRLHAAIGDSPARLVLRGHDEAVATARFSPRGGAILTASGDRTARLFDFAGKELAVFRGHEGRVGSAEFSPDGERVLTASGDGTARVWDLRGSALSTLKGHGDTLWSAVFSPQGDRIVTASVDGTARLWDLDGKEITVFRGHAGSVFGAAFSPAGDRVVTAGGDSTARVFDLMGREVGVLVGHTATVWKAMFSGDGDRVLTASGDDAARLWDLSGKTLAVFRGHDAPVTGAVFSPDGDRVLTSCYDRTARLWDLSGEEHAVFGGHKGPVFSAVFSRQGDRVLTAGGDDTARVWDLEGKEVQVLRGHGGSVLSASFSTKGDRVVTASEDHTARTWHLAGDEVALLDGHFAPVIGASFGPAGDRVLTTSYDQSARIWDLAGEATAVLKGHDGWVLSAVLSPGGDLALTASGDHTARIWDRAGTSLVTLAGHEDTVCGAAFSPAGDRVLTWSADGAARLWDLEGRPLVRFAGHEAPVIRALFAPSGDRVVTASYDQTARVWDLASKTTAILRGHGGWLLGAVISPAGDRILTASADRTARLWDFEGKALAVFKGHRGSVLSAVFSPAGDQVLTASDDRTARLWDLDGKQIAAFEGHGGQVFGAVFSPESDLILTSSEDRTARLWSPSGKALAVLRRHSDSIPTAVFSPDGSRVLTGSADGTARLWCVYPKDLLSLADRRVTREFTDDERDRYRDLL